MRCPDLRRATHCHSESVPGLGATSFPTSSKSPQAQAAFLCGLLLLHLFEYTDAAVAFVSAQSLDPAFAVAYWGEAMTLNHGVWIRSMSPPASPAPSPAHVH